MATAPYLQWKPSGDALLDAWAGMALDNLKQGLLQFDPVASGYVHALGLDALRGKPDELTERLYQMSMRWSGQFNPVAVELMLAAYQVRGFDQLSSSQVESLMQRFKGDPRMYQLYASATLANWSQANEPGDAGWTRAYAAIIEAVEDGVADGLTMSMLLALYDTAETGFLSSAAFMTAPPDQALKPEADRAARRQAATGLVARLGWTKRQLIDEIIRRDPQWPPGYYELAKELVSDGDWSGALDALQKGSAATGAPAVTYFPQSYRMSARAFQSQSFGLLLAIAYESFETFDRHYFGEGLVKAHLALIPSQDHRSRLAVLQAYITAKLRLMTGPGKDQAYVFCSPSLFHLAFDEAAREIGQQTTGIGQAYFNTCRAIAEDYEETWLVAAQDCGHRDNLLMPYSAQSWVSQFVVCQQEEVGRASHVRFQQQWAPQVARYLQKLDLPSLLDTAQTE